MSRQGRLDFSEAIHYVGVAGHVGASILFDTDLLGRHPENPWAQAPDLQWFEFLLARACDECGALIHGYAWLPNCAIIVLQRFEVPLDIILGSVCGQYARYLRGQGRIPRNQAVYRSRYESKVIAPMYLSYAVRRAHWSPVGVGLCESPADYHLSSDAVYAAKAPPRWVSTAQALGAVELRGRSRTAAYREFMNRGESEYVRQLFTRGSKWDRRVVGDRAFVGEAVWRASHAAPPPSRNEVIGAVAVLLGTSPSAVYEQTPTGVLGRALVAWYASRSGAATLSETGRWFCRSATTLRREIDKYRELKPALFRPNMQELHGLAISRDHLALE